MKALRLLAFILPAVCCGLVLTSCSGKPSDVPTVAKRHWPPDTTLTLAVIAPGTIRLSTLCAANASRDSSAWSATYKLTSIVRDKRGPQDTSAVYWLRSIIEGKDVHVSPTVCLMMQWIPDTPSVPVGQQFQTAPR
jgi:hypothetical protein